MSGDNTFGQIVVVCNVQTPICYGCCMRGGRSIYPKSYGTIDAKDANNNLFTSFAALAGALAMVSDAEASSCTFKFDTSGLAENALISRTQIDRWAIAPAGSNPSSTVELVLNSESDTLRGSSALFWREETDTVAGRNFIQPTVTTFDGTWTFLNFSGQATSISSGCGTGRCYINASFGPDGSFPYELNFNEVLEKTFPEKTRIFFTPADDPIVLTDYLLGRPKNERDALPWYLEFYRDTDFSEAPIGTPIPEVPTGFHPDDRFEIQQLLVTSFDPETLQAALARPIQLVARPERVVTESVDLPIDISDPDNWLQKNEQGIYGYRFSNSGLLPIVDIAEFDAESNRTTALVAPVPLPAAGRMRFASIAALAAANCRKRA